MNSLLAAVCLISGLVTPGCAIFCTQCSTTVGNACSGVTVSCASKLVCISIFQSSRVGSQESFEFVRGCGEKKECDLSGVFSVPAGKMRFSATCCNSNYCSPYTPTLPNLNYTNNGKTCPYCISENSLDCKSNVRMNCMGAENKCALENSEYSTGSSTLKSSIRGCSTKGFCDLGTRKTESGVLKSKLVVKCSASTALYSAVTLLILATMSLIINVF